MHRSWAEALFPPGLLLAPVREGLSPYEVCGSTVSTASASWVRPAVPRVCLLGSPHA